MKYLALIILVPLQIARIVLARVLIELNKLTLWIEDRTGWEGRDPL